MRGGVYFAALTSIASPRQRNNVGCCRRGKRYASHLLLGLGHCVVEQCAGVVGRCTIETAGVWRCRCRGAVVVGANTCRRLACSARHRRSSPGRAHVGATVFVAACCNDKRNDYYHCRRRSCTTAAALHIVVGAHGCVYCSSNSCKHRNHALLVNQLVGHASHRFVCNRVALAWWQVGAGSSIATHAIYARRVHCREPKWPNFSRTHSCTVGSAA